MIQTAVDIRLKILPLLNTVEHQFYYEGPCRFGQGETLAPGYDRLANAQKIEAFLSNMREYLPEGCDLLEPVRMNRTDNWDNQEKDYTNLAAAVAACDVVAVMSGIACDDRVVEFTERYRKPIILPPSAGFSDSTTAAALQAKPGVYEVYSEFNWEAMSYDLKILRARKVIQNTRILCANRFGSTTSYSAVDAFNSHDLLTERLGVRFRFVNIHEMLDQMSPAAEGGNPTTPGRITPDLTEADLAEANRICDEMCAGATANTMTRDKMMPSLIAYVTVKKLMDQKDCNGFTMPCPDACSTRRLNEMAFTPCIIHALNMEAGIPSACEYDTDAVLSQQALIAVSGKRPYMGNTCPIPFEKGHLSARFGTTPEQLAKLEEGDISNLYMMQHSVAHRRIADPNQDAPYSVHHFAHDQKFGVTMRYDFNRDAGQKITICRFSPDGSKLFICSAEIVAGGGHDSFNCSQLVYFRVPDQKEAWAKQCMAGNHCTMVYGDYVQELTDLAKVLNVEPLVVGK